MKRKICLFVAMVLLLATASAALAGGWAVVTLDEPPGEIRAGEPWTLGFTVLQHGQTPVHRLDANSPVEPVLVAENPATGRRVEAEATATEEVGHFVVEVTFPVDGTWQWTIYPAPLAGESLFEPLTVLPALNAAAVEPAAEAVAPVIQPAVVRDESPQPAAQPEPAQPVTNQPSAAQGDGLALPTVLRWAALGVGLVAVALFVLQSRRRTAVQVEH